MVFIKYGMAIISIMKKVSAILGVMDITSDRIIKSIVTIFAK